MFDHWGYGIGGLWHALSTAFMAIGAFLLLIVVLGLAVLLARYLLVATKAAELYVARHGEGAPPPATAAAPAAAAPAPGEPVGSEAVADAAAAPTAPVAPEPPQPPKRPAAPRTPKKPPSA